jgi:poly-beta-1,6-N-acetyl-D-glucosamine synthase
VKPWNQPRWMLRFLTAIDLLIPALDVAYALVWLPGLVLAATGRYRSSARGLRPSGRG